MSQRTKKTAARGFLSLIMIGILIVASMVRVHPQNKVPFVERNPLLIEFIGVVLLFAIVFTVALVGFFRIMCAAFPSNEEHLR